MCIDMHVHTTASDGILTPTQVITWAVRLGLEGISITDHDTLGGIEEAIAESKKHDKFIMIPGIEFSTQYKGSEIHILGYGFDHRNTQIVELTNEIKESRQDRGKKIVEKLISLGYKISYSELLDLADGGAIGRPHIARILLQRGYVTSIQEAFEKLLNKGTPGYVERFKLTLEKATDVIKEAGGVPVLAHPGLIDDNIDIQSLMKFGIQGIEVFHSKHTNNDIENYSKIASKYSLIVTGGSDYHDTYNNNIPTLGSVGVPRENVLNLQNKCYNKFIT